MRKLGIRGQVDFGIGSVITLLVLVAVGAVVVYQITGSLPRTSGSYADNAISGVESTGSTVFNLATILAIVIVAGLIIGVIMTALGRPGPAPGPAMAPPL
jgi:hypothetical protein